MLSEALSKLKENGKNRVNHCEVVEIQTAPVPVGSRDHPVHTDDTKTHQKLSAKGKHEEHIVLVMALALIGKFTISAVYYQIYIHTAELYLTVIRTIGVGFSLLCARSGGMAAPYILDATGLVWVPPIIFGATSFSAGVIAMLLPETRGKPLPDFVGKKSGGDGKGILSEQKQEFADYTSTV